MARAKLFFTLPLRDNLNAAIAANVVHVEFLHEQNLDIALNIDENRITYALLPEFSKIFART